MCKQFDCKECSAFNKCGGFISNSDKSFSRDCIARRLIVKNGFNSFLDFKKKVINKINNLGIKELKVDDLNLLSASFVNLEYELENGTKVKLLNNNNVYLGQQIER